jgi:hypothetical protein
LTELIETTKESTRMIQQSTLIQQTANINGGGSTGDTSFLGIMSKLWG